MRCKCCNKNLNDWESTAKHAETGEYLDTCRNCLVDLGIPIAGRNDLNPDEEMYEEQEIDWDDSFLDSESL